MDRRRFLVTSLAGVLAAPLVAQAQPAAPPPGRLWRVGILFQADTRGPYLEAIRQGFRDLGYVEGRDLTIEARSAAGDLTRLAHLAQELVRLPVDVIMTPSPGISAAMTATTTIPIVMLTSSGPVGKGQVQSVARPGGNVTGMTFAFDRAYLPKQLQFFKEAAPKVSRVGILSTSAALAPPGEPDIHETVLDAARQLALTVFFVPLDDAAQLDTALATVTRERADALLLNATGPNIVRRHEIAKFALRHRLPSIAGMREIADAGSLLTYMPDYFDMFRRAPSYVDRIFKGATPGDLPVQQGNRWNLIINLKTAKALGLTIPPSLLARADQVIE
jgi:putative ABC transport system substrate-binding protein